MSRPRIIILIVALLSSRLSRYTLALADRTAGVNDVAGADIGLGPGDGGLFEEGHLVPEWVRLEVALVVLAAVLRGDSDAQGWADLFEFAYPAQYPRSCKSGRILIATFCIDATFCSVSYYRK